MKIDINKHKFLLVSILKDIYSDTELSTSLGFKGGTAQMLFYNLPRFSVDLDFNLIKQTKAKIVFAKIRNILMNIEKINNKHILDGLGEMVDEKLKIFVKEKLKTETIHLLKMYKEFPLLG